MNYIGSKHSLLSEIAAVLDEQGVGGEGIALDLFAGTGAVAQLLKVRGHVTYANDWQRYSYVTNVAFIGLNDFPTFDRLLSDDVWGPEIGSALPDGDIMTFCITGRDPLSESSSCGQVLRYLDQVEGQRGLFFETYCHSGEAGRMAWFITPRNEVISTLTI